MYDICLEELRICSSVQSDFYVHAVQGGQFGIRPISCPSYPQWIINGNKQVTHRTEQVKRSNGIGLHSDRQGTVSHHKGIWKRYGNQREKKRHMALDDSWKRAHTLLCSIVQHTNTLILPLFFCFFLTWPQPLTSLMLLRLNGQIPTATLWNLAANL